VLLDLAKPGDTFLDVGANIGYYSVVFLKRVKNSNAICFEPQPGIVDLLMTNVSQFPGWSKVYQVGSSTSSSQTDVPTTSDHADMSRNERKQL
jgi:FkbM family methyltransferase